MSWVLGPGRILFSPAAFTPARLGSSLVWWNLINDNTVTLNPGGITGNEASNVIDSGFSGTHGISATSGNECIYSSTGGQNSTPELTNDATNFYTFSTGIDSGAPWTQYHVLSVGNDVTQTLLTDASTTTVYVSTSTGVVGYYNGSFQDSLTDIRSLGWIVLRIVQEGAIGAFKVRVNKNAEDDSTPGDDMGVTFTKYMGAAASTQCFKGSIAESVHISGIISLGDDANMMAYFKNKYAFAY